MLSVKSKNNNPKNTDSISVNIIICHITSGTINYPAKLVKSNYFFHCCILTSGSNDEVFVPPNQSDSWEESNAFSQSWIENTAVSYLPGLVVEPHKSMIPGQHLAVEGGVVLGRSAASHRPSDLDWLVQVHMSLLEWVRVGSAGEHGQCWRHWFWLECVTPTRHNGEIFLIQIGRVLVHPP